MDNSSPNVSAMPERRLPAWSFSILVHSAMIALLAFAVQQSPRGAAEEAGRTAGIVLKRASAEGDLYEGEEDLAHVAQAEAAENVDVLDSLPARSTGPSADRDLPKIAGAGPAAAAGGGQPNIGEFTGGRQRGSIGGGDTARVSVFGVQGTGSKFVYLFDRSTSMEGPPIEAAKRQLVESLQSLDSIHQFQIIFFNTEQSFFDPTEGRGRLAFASEQNKRAAARYVGGITAALGTDRYTALKKAIALRPDVVFFLTDAEDEMLPGDLAEIRRANERVGAAICVIEFGLRPAPSRNNFLMELARQNGGQYGYIDTTRLSK
jgi:hypothetical protein